MKLTRSTRWFSALALLASAAACSSKPAPEPTSPDSIPPDPEPSPAAQSQPHDVLTRQRFNQLAVREDLPVYWSADKNSNGSVEPDELNALLFYGSDPAYVTQGAFTPEFESEYQRLVAADKAPEPSGADAERQKLVLQDLDQGSPTLVWSDLSKLPADEKQFVQHILSAANLVHELYLTQNGAAALAEQVPKEDPASQSLFRRNRGPRCLGPKTEKNPKCSAIPGAPQQIVDVYPASLQKGDTKFCQALEKHKSAKELMKPFVVVREDKGVLKAEPYSAAYSKQMQAIAGELTAAADAIKTPSEEALRSYLRAAAKAFGDNNWEPADEAWAKMNAKNSKWYLRVGPDETYWEPCSQKAGFHVTFARINSDSLAWQDKLSPHQQAMEDSIAKLIGRPYTSRKVTFHLPDFIDIVWNAGDDRDAFGATIGQSLPNWGPVANEGRGRTVAMSNLYTDPDSQATRKQQSASLIDAEAMKRVTGETTPMLVGTILHEATHNLGPAHEYKFAGKTDDQWFGGGLASMLEELKAQTGALYLNQFIAEKGLISKQLAEQAYVDSVVWAFGHISRGMWTEDGKRKAYSQLAAIQIGFLLDEGALSFDPKAKAANGTDAGAFSVHFDKFPAAAEKLMKLVAGIKARGDKKGAEALAKKYVDTDVVPQKLITERFLRFPKVSFVYATAL